MIDAPARICYTNPMKRTVTGLLLLVSCFFLFASTPEEWEQGTKTCTAILDQIREHHPDPPEEMELVHASLHGLLARLDPHSYFLDPDSFRSIFEDQRGNYFGIGTKIRRIDGRLTVIAPMEGTPAFHLGILPGDVITAIDDHPTLDMTLDEAMKRLRGREGTKVTITVSRQGNPLELTFHINRIEIPLTTLTHSMLEPGDPRTGYIGLRTFGRTTPDEFHQAVESLVNRGGIKRLVIDLRWNTGGSLAAAIELADFFLQPGRPIVTIRGRSIERGFSARKPLSWPDLKLAVLINRYSASASEILAAALQEHGKAKVVGMRSWGKGLVETVFNLPGNRGMALTTARYYTPRGRCLQRRYGDSHNPYGYQVPENYDSDTAIPGGVMPDIKVEDRRQSRVVRELIARGAFFHFSRVLLDAGVNVSRDLKAAEVPLTRFKSFLSTRHPDSVIPVSAETEIRREILRALMTSAFSESAGFRIFLIDDPVNGAALKYLQSPLAIKEP